MLEDRKMAIKLIDRKSAHTLNAFENESSILESLAGHPNVLQIIESFTVDRCVQKHAIGHTRMPYFVVVLFCTQQYSVERFARKTRDVAWPKQHPQMQTSPRKR